MKTINDLITPSSDSGTKPSGTSSGSTHWSAQTERLVTLVFTRFWDLFGTKCTTRGLEIYQDEDRGIHSDTFLLWCRKCQKLSEAAFTRGIERVEELQGKSITESQDMWPPSYAEFIALCEYEEPKGFGGMYQRFPPLVLPDQAAKERAAVVGERELETMKSMFD